MEEFNCVRETQITKEMNDLLVDAFLVNPMYGEYLFGADRDKLSSMTSLCLLYYCSYGVIYSLRNSDNEMVALSLWGVPNVPVIGFFTLLTRGLFFAMLKYSLKIGFKSSIKQIKIDAINQRNHIKEPHYYLCMLGSIKKGCGRILFKECLDKFKGNTIFLESSVFKDNHAYYKSLGGEMIKEVIINGYSSAYFLWKSDK